MNTPERGLPVPAPDQSEVGHTGRDDDEEVYTDPYLEALRAGQIDSTFDPMTTGVARHNRQLRGRIMGRR